MCSWGKQVICNGQSNHSFKKRHFFHFDFEYLKLILELVGRSTLIRFQVITEEKLRQNGKLTDSLTPALERLSSSDNSRAGPRKINSPVDKGVHRSPSKTLALERESLPMPVKHFHLTIVDCNSIKPRVLMALYSEGGKYFKNPFIKKET